MTICYTSAPSPDICTASLIAIIHDGDMGKESAQMSNDLDLPCILEAATPNIAERTSPFQPEIQTIHMSNAASLSMPSANNNVQNESIAGMDNQLEPFSFFSQPMFGEQEDFLPTSGPPPSKAIAVDYNNLDQIINIIISTQCLQINETLDNVDVFKSPTWLRLFATHEFSCFKPPADLKIMTMNWVESYLRMLEHFMIATTICTVSHIGRSDEFCEAERELNLIYSLTDASQLDNYNGSIAQFLQIIRQLMMKFATFPSLLDYIWSAFSDTLFVMIDRASSNWCNLQIHVSRPDSIIFAYDAFRQKVLAKALSSLISPAGSSLELHIQDMKNFYQQTMEKKMISKGDCRRLHLKDLRNAIAMHTRDTHDYIEAALIRRFSFTMDDTEKLQQMKDLCHRFMSDYANIFHQILRG